MKENNEVNEFCCHYSYRGPNSNDVVEDRKDIENVTYLLEFVNNRQYFFSGWILENIVGEIVNTCPFGTEQKKEMVENSCGGCSFTKDKKGRYV